MIFSDRYRQDNNIWLPNEKYNFQYSDGDETEDYIFQAIRESSDISTGSRELTAKIKDWPSLYHLSPRRADLLRPLVHHLRNKTILEIGSGCGAITRFLGELNAEVLALEGSSRRASITRARCRELTNVTVVSDNFDDFITEEQFDCITLIGVLEYSNLFISGNNPPLAMLRKVRSMLKPDGFILVAIENQLGLKYLAGAPEDHVGVPFAGVEGRYTPDTAVTFGKKELSSLLDESGLTKTQFLYPFPDYKLPVTIVTEKGLRQQGFDVPGLLLEKQEYFQGHPYNSFFSSSLAERAVFRNHLTGEMANSFLVLASSGMETGADPSLLAATYSTMRSKPFCKAVEFVAGDSGNILIKKKKLYDQEMTHAPVELRVETEPYRYGTLLQEQLVRIVSINNWSLEQLISWARKYHSVLMKYAHASNGQLLLDGKYLDLTPFNIIIEDSGPETAIDQEWRSMDELPLQYVFFRGLYYSLGQVVLFNLPGPDVPRCLLELTNLLAGTVDEKSSFDQNEFRRREKKYFSAVWMQDYKPFMPEPMRIRHYDRTLEELHMTKAQLQHVTMRKDQVEAQEQRILKTLNEKERLLQDLQFNYNLTRQQLAEVNNKLVTIYESDGWKWLSRYYHVKGKLLNENSFHYKVLKKVVNFLRNKKETGSLSGGSTVRAVENRPSPSADDVEVRTQVLPFYEDPEVSIVIPVYNAWEMNVKCITSILQNTTDTSYEVIVADDCSTDRTKDIDDYFLNIVHVRNEKNLGFILNCNNAAARARGRYIHFLNNDTEVQPGWLSSLVLLMKKDEKIGLAGSKLIYPDGLLQEAGGIIWKDASGWNFGHRQDPGLPEFNYVKEVDYISGASILVRKDLWHALGGFATEYSPAYCEDSDMAFRIRQKGYKVMYQPLSVVVHYEGYSHGSDHQKSGISSIKDYQRINNAKFFEKWKPVLQKDQFSNGENVFWARDRSRSRKTLLMVDHYVPQYDRDAGSRTTFQYLELFVKMGFNVKFLGENFYRHEPYTTLLQQMGIEVLYGPWYANNWKQWFIGNRDKFDYVYLNRPHVSINFIDFFKQHSTAKILYYGHDLHFLRKEKEYELEKDKDILSQAARWKEIELSLFGKSDIILTPSLDEQRIIRSLSSDFNVQLMRPYIYKTIHEPIIDFTRRKDIFFIGGFNHGPNVDGVLWFAKEVWPLVKAELPGIRFIIAGSNPPAPVTSLASDESIVIKGYIGDDELERLYSTCKIAVIPLRFGAGVKGKTVEAMQYGLPLVTTSFGVEGLPGDYSFLKVADRAGEFARLLTGLYHDEADLMEISQKSIHYIKNNFTEAIATEIMSKALATVKLETDEQAV